MRVHSIALACALAAVAWSTARAGEQDPATPDAAPASDTATGADKVPTKRSLADAQTTTEKGGTGTSSSEASPSVVDNPGAADHTKDATNTKMNARDRGRAVTPMSQGNSGPETEITAAIRRGIMKDRSLSFSGKNAKVITVGSTVTLRGPVESDQARTAIESLAKSTAGVTAVDNQLEVKK